MNAITVRGIRKRYGDVQAVDGISFEVARGEIFGLLGPNGAGKTTTLEIIEGLREADEGDVEVLGLRPWPRNVAMLPRIGVQLQSSSFFDHLTAREQIRLFAAMYGAAADRADAALSMVGLDERDSARVEKLSGGQKQRLSIACALAHDPEIVFLDEPTAALDPQARRNFWDVIRAVQEAGKTVILTTHHMDEAEQLCDRVAIVDAGRILTLDAPDALIRQLDAPTRVAFARGRLDLATVTALPGAFDVWEGDEIFVLYTLDATPTIAALAAHDALHGLQVRGATLEDVFLRLTGREYRE